MFTFSDRDLVEEADRAKIAEALDGANIFFGSLLFDYDQVDNDSASSAHWRGGRTIRSYLIYAMVFSRSSG